MKSVYFDFGRPNIPAHSFLLLDKVAETLKGNPHIKQVRIEGHTDSRGEDSSSMNLSNNRAREVRIDLINKSVDATRLTSKGYGETRPIATHETEQGRAQNQRVDFVSLRADKRQGCN